ncbi:MAG TPA: hypothetical protein VFW52_01820 [Candidatus Saccharimonadales bacterium]|nr:hypothetical protein [Candidatus Saccharimonadales bacterium]
MESQNTPFPVPSQAENASALENRIKPEAPNNVGEVIKFPSQAEAIAQLPKSDDTPEQSQAQPDASGSPESQSNQQAA